MKPLIMVSLSLLVIWSGLKLHNRVSNLADTFTHKAKYYWHKRVHKEILRDTAERGVLRGAIDNSLHFINCGLPDQLLPY